MAKKPEIIKTEVSKSAYNNGINFTEYGVLPNGLKYRVKIHAESISSQQYAKIELFNREQLEWKGVGEIEFNTIRTDYKLTYKGDPEAADFKADRDHLIKLAGSLLD